MLSLGFLSAGDNSGVPYYLKGWWLQAHSLDPYFEEFDQ
jgi:hypothetical protein